MLFLASVFSCLLGALATEPSKPVLLTSVGELVFQPGFEVRKDSFVSLAPVQSVSFRGTRWTAREFYVRFKRGGKDVDIQWLEPLPGDGKTIVDTAYGPFSWRDGHLTKDIELAATAMTPLRVQLDSASSLESSLGWLEARRVSLAKDGSIAIEQDTVWLRLRTGLSFQASRILLHGPLRWNGAFPRQRLPASNLTSVVKIDSLWLLGSRLEAKNIRHCQAQDTCRTYAHADLSLSRRLLRTTFEPNGHWPISYDLGIAWKGAAGVADGKPRFANPRLLADLYRPARLTSGWCTPAGAPVASDSVSLAPVSEHEFASTRPVFRCDDQGLLWQGNILLRWNGLLEDGSLWSWSFQPTGIGIAGVVDEYGKPFRIFDSTVRDSFQAGGIDALLRAYPKGLTFKVRDRNFPTTSFRGGDPSSSRLVFSNGSRARLLSGREALACSPTDTLPRLPIPILLHRAGACLELENPPTNMAFFNAKDWGTFRPDKIWKLLPYGRSYEMSGVWIPSKPIRSRFQTDSIRSEVSTAPPTETDAGEQPGPKWSAGITWTVPASWFTGMESEDLSGKATMKGQLNGQSMNFPYEAPTDSPTIFKRLVSPYPVSWKGHRVSLEAATIDLTADAKVSNRSFTWRTVARYDRIEHPWGWIYQFDRPAPLKFRQNDSTEIFQNPSNPSRVSLPEDGNPNPVAKGLPRPLTPPLPAWSEPSLPYSSLPAPPVRTGRVVFKLDSLLSLRIDRLMASVADYDSCLATGKCTPVAWDSLLDTGNARMWKTRGKWPESVQNGLDSIQARQYCTFRGGRLPRREEWRLVMSQTLPGFGTWNNLSSFKGLEHWCRNSPQIPGQLVPSGAGLFDLFGNGAVWCQGGRLCEIPSDPTCLAPVPERWTVGVRCVE